MISDSVGCTPPHRQKQAFSPCQMGLRGWLHSGHTSSEPVGAGNGGIGGSFMSIVFSIVIGSRAVPDLYR